MMDGSVLPDLITFSTLIKGYCRVKDIEKALELHNQMLERGIKADEVLYNSLLDGCLKANQDKMALKCYENMKKLRIKPSTFFLCFLFFVCLLREVSGAVPLL